MDKAAAGSGFAACKSIGAVPESLETARHPPPVRIEPPLACKTEPAAVPAVAAAVGNEAVLGERDGKQCLAHFDRRIGQVVEPARKPVCAVALRMPAPATDLNLEIDPGLAGDQGVRGLEGQDIRDAVIGCGNPVGCGRRQSPQNGRDDPVPRRHAICDGRGRIAIGDAAGAAANLNRPVGPGICHDRAVAQTEQRAIDSRLRHV